jgi:hypothetical protein
MLRQRFREVRLYTQSPTSARWWSPRALVCENSPWKKVRGFGRLRLAFKKCFYPETIGDPTAGQRTGALALILQLTRSRRRFLNQYVVRPYRRLHFEKSMYLVATAVR